MMDGVTLRRKGDAHSLCVGMLPGRKNPCVYWWNSFDGVVRVVAHFRSMEEGEKVADYLWSLANSTVVVDADDA